MLVNNVSSKLHNNLDYALNYMNRICISILLIWYIDRSCGHILSNIF